MNTMADSIPAMDTEDLFRVLSDCAPATIAVSGGVDSVTLSTFAHRVLGRERVRVVHAVSPAVPPVATERVRDFALREGWRLDILDAGEFGDERYRSNPVNRCFFCKSSLYSALRKVSKETLLSGTNIDDLGDFRPGLAAADEHAVRHPFVEAGFPKGRVRKLAASLDLSDLADLPAAPCLASRVETGLRVEPDTLVSIDRIETWFRSVHSVQTVRCRFRKSGVVIELDAITLAKWALAERDSLIEHLRKMVPEFDAFRISFAPYVRGSAFVGAKK